MSTIPTWLAIAISAAAAILALFLTRRLVGRWHPLAQAAGTLAVALLLNVIESATRAFLGIDNYVRRPVPFVPASVIYLGISMMWGAYTRLRTRSIAKYSNSSER